MNLKMQKRIAGDVLGVSSKRVWFDSSHNEEIKEAITKYDVRVLVGKGIIRVKPVKGVSRARARVILRQKRKGRRKGSGSRKGKATARLSRKSAWMNLIRPQRRLLTILKEKRLLDSKIYRDLRQKAKGGFFRSKRHIQLYVKDRGLLKDGQK